jgi:hypothetical protein
MAGPAIENGMGMSWHQSNHLTKGDQTSPPVVSTPGNEASHPERSDGRQGLLVSGLYS